MISARALLDGSFDFQFAIEVDLGFSDFPNQGGLPPGPTLDGRFSVVGFFAVAEEQVALGIHAQVIARGVEGMILSTTEHPAKDRSGVEGHAIPKP